MHSTMHGTETWKRTVYTCTGTITTCLTGTLPSLTNTHEGDTYLQTILVQASTRSWVACYSSKDPAVIDKHMLQLRSAGVGVIAVSWYPAGLSDDEGPPPDPVIPVLLDAALTHGIKITLHIEPYKGRTPQSVRNDLQYIHTHYTKHPAFYKLERISPSSGVYVYMYKCTCVRT